MNKDNNNKLKKYKATRLKAARGFPSFGKRGREDERDNSKSSITRKQPRNKEEYDKMKKDGTLFGDAKKEPISKFIFKSIAKFFLLSSALSMSIITLVASLAKL